MQDQSIAPIEMFPFFIMDNSLFFSDLRFFPTIDGTFGGNTGFGYRYYSPGFDRILGISPGWYDSDGTGDPIISNSWASVSRAMAAFSISGQTSICLSARRIARRRFLPSTTRPASSAIMWPTT